MPVMQERNSEAQLLGSVDHLFYDDRNFCGEWIDSAGSAGFIAAITLPLATARHHFFPEAFTMASNILTVLAAGFYCFDWTVYATKAGSTEGSFYSFLEEDPATAVFATVPASTVITTCFSAAGTVHNSLILKAQANYRYRVQVASFGTNFSTLANQSRFSVMRLFKN